MRLGGPGLHASRSMAIGLLSLACALGTTHAQEAPAPATLTVSPGLSASELALDQVPPGTTIAQFLLALYKLNPAAFLDGDLNRLQVKARMRLPTAEEANQVPLAQAREDIARLQAGLPLATDSAPGKDSAPASPTTPPATPPVMSSAPAPEATAEAVPALPPTPPASPAPAAATPPTSPELPLAWLGAGVALLLALGALSWRRRPKPAAPPSAPAAGDMEAQAQGRFKPALPQEKGPTPPPAQPTPKPALFDLDLNLGGSAPALDLNLPKANTGTSGPSLGPLPDLDLPTAPSARSPGPLDLSGLSLDLDTPSPAPPQDKTP